MIGLVEMQEDPLPLITFARFARDFVIFALACSPTVIPSASSHRTARQPRFFYLIVLEKNENPLFERIGQRRSFSSSSFFFSPSGQVSLPFLFRISRTSLFLLPVLSFFFSLATPRRMTVDVLLARQLKLSRPLRDSGRRGLRATAARAHLFQVFRLKEKTMRS